MQCAKHTKRNAKHGPSRGVWGHAPPQENFEKKVLRYAILMTFHLHVIASHIIHSAYEDVGLKFIIL